MLQQLKYFNTSYVVIKPKNIVIFGDGEKHFNTSYVVIKLEKRGKKLIEQGNFNTSYVVIKQWNQYRCK